MFWNNVNSRRLQYFSTLLIEITHVISIWNRRKNKNKFLYSTAQKKLSASYVSGVITLHMADVMPSAAVKDTNSVMMFTRKHCYALNLLNLLNLNRCSRDRERERREESLPFRTPTPDRRLDRSKTIITLRVLYFPHHAMAYPQPRDLERKISKNYINVFRTETSPTN